MESIRDEQKQTDRYAILNYYYVDMYIAWVSLDNSDDHGTPLFNGVFVSDKGYNIALERIHNISHD